MYACTYMYCMRNSGRICFTKKGKNSLKKGGSPGINVLYRVLGPACGPVPSRNVYENGFDFAEIFEYREKLCGGPNF